MLKKRICKIGLAITCLAGLPSGVHAQAVYSFSTGGQTGATVPTQANINATYPSSLSTLVTVVNGIQQFTVPTTGPYRISAVGAQGGYNGGNGAYVSGDFTLTAGTVLKILVGQQGTSANNGSNGSGGGGGGSFVASMTNVPYIVAGGGGGNGDGYNGLGNSTPCCRNGMEANLTTSGSGYAPSTTGGTPGSTGGTGGYAGLCQTTSGYPGSGYYGDGAVCNSGTGAAALSFTNGGAAGTNGTYPGNTTNLGGDGGFGGGGGTYNSGSGERGGGGGGYSGGGGGVANTGYDAAGGGGGCLISSTAANPTASLVTSTGNGKVTISLLCDVHINLSTLTGTFPAICSGQSATLSTNAASNFSWSPGGQTTQSIVVNPSSNTTYSVTGTSSLGCNSGGVVTLTVNGGLPSLSITTSTNSTCLGNTVSISASGALTYTFSGGISSGVSFTPAAGVTTYTINGGNGCGVTTSLVPITIAPLPIGVSASFSLICASKPTTLTASGAASYTWNPGASNYTSYIVNPSANTIYTVTGMTGSCTGQSTIAITTKPNPTLSISVSNTNVCAGNAVNLTVSGNAVTYTWNPTGQTGNTLTDYPTNVTLYTASGTNTGNCVSSVQQAIVVNALPVVSATSSNSLVCSGGTSTLLASGASTYAWAGGSNAATSSMVVNPVTDATYTVTGTNSFSCSSSAMITVNVFVPSLSISNGTAVCFGSNAVIGASTADSWQWSSGQTSQNITVTPTLTSVYSVTAMVNNFNGLSCPATAATQVSVNPLPIITVTSTHYTVCFGNSAVLTASGAATYTWSGGASVVTAASMTVSPIATQNYTVKATDASGCKSAAIFNQQVSPCTGISVNTANTANLSIYPNPSSEELTISSDQTIHLTITNELGQEVRTVSLDQDNSSVKINNLANGIYFVAGANENGRVVQKIIVAK